MHFFFIELDSHMWILNSLRTLRSCFTAISVHRRLRANAYGTFTGIITVLNTKACCIEVDTCKSWVRAGNIWTYGQIFRTKFPERIEREGRKKKVPKLANHWLVSEGSSGLRLTTAMEKVPRHMRITLLKIPVYFFLLYIQFFSVWSIPGYSPQCIPREAF